MVYHMSNVLNKQQEFATTAFGETSVSQAEPILQITAQYGLLDDVLTAALGGSATAQDSKFVVSSGTGANNVATIVSAKQATYRAGQGLLTRFTALFQDGVVDNTQIAGFITSESAFAFGYNGAEFGILHARNGALEIQELQMTTPASGSENATVTIDGNPFTVALTVGSVQHNAYEISASLNAQVSGYDFSSTDDVVTCLANLSDFGAGAFTFSSATAAGAFTEIQSGLVMDEIWVNKADWNIKPDININPALGNVYQVQLQYLGFGGIRFFVEDPETAKLELVHIIKYANTEVVPSVKNPIFRMGWAVRNTGNTTDITIQGSSGAVFVEGKIVLDGRQSGFCHEALSVGTTRTNILAIKNRLSFNGTANRADLIPISLNMATDTTKTALYEIVLNPVIATGESLIFESTGTDKLAEIAKDQSEVIGGEVLACFNVKASGSFSEELFSAISAIFPGDIIAVVARVTSGSSATMDASLISKDDL